MLVTGKSVRIWGVCPDLVTIVGSASAFGAFDIRPGGSATELHTLAITGSSGGIAISGAKDVLVDRVWIHDTAAQGLTPEDPLGPTAVRVVGSLVETSHRAGIFAAGADVVVERSVIRNVVLDGGFGRGIDAEGNPDTGRRANVTVRTSVIALTPELGIRWTGSDGSVDSTVIDGASSNGGIAVEDQSATGGRSVVTISRTLVEGARESGVSVFNSDVTIDRTVVRDTAIGPLGYGYGISLVTDAPVDPSPLATIRNSLVERNHGAGVLAAGSAVDVEMSVMRGTAPVVDLGIGVGLIIQDDPGIGARGNARVAASLIERNEGIGILVNGSDADVEASVVRDTLVGADGLLGRGVQVTHAPAGGGRANVTIESTLIERSIEVGVSISGSDAIMNAIAVRDTLPDPNGIGRGINVQPDSEFAERSSARLDASSVERSHDVGIFVAGSDIVIDGTTVGETSQNAAGGYGDGVVVTFDTHTSLPATGALSSTRIETSAGAGLANFGATISMTSLLIECASVPLEAEGTSYSFTDGGGNLCGCPEAKGACVAQSTGVAAPEPVAPVK